MTRRISISEARGKLPELAKFLARHPDQVVLVEHRDLKERLALTTEAHLRYLETMVRELKRQTSRPFSLSGSLASELDDEALEAALQEMAGDQTRQREEKLRGLAS